MGTTPLLRIAGMAAAAALVAAWLTAATATPQVTALPGEVSLPTPAAMPSVMALSLATEVDRLRERVARAPVPPETMRNPFELPRAVARPVPSAPAERRDVPAPVVTPAPVSHAVTLVGIAVHETADGEERTVILSLTGEVVLARTGESLAGGLRVVEVMASGVRLEDASGAVVRLDLP